MGRKSQQTVWVYDNVDIQKICKTSTQCIYGWDQQYCWAPAYWLRDMSVFCNMHLRCLICVSSLIVISLSIASCYWMHDLYRRGLLYNLYLDRRQHCQDNATKIYRLLLSYYIWYCHLCSPRMTRYLSWAFDSCPSASSACCARIHRTTCILFLCCGIIASVSMSWVWLLPIVGTACIIIFNIYQGCTTAPVSRIQDCNSLSGTPSSAQCGFGKKTREKK